MQTAGLPAARRQDEVRLRNLSALLRLVHEHGPTSRAVLGEALALNRSTIGSLTAELSAAGLVSEQTPDRSPSVGRPSLVVAPRGTAVHALVCEVAVDRVTVARVGLGGLVLEEREEAVDERSHAFPDVLERVVRLAAAVRSSEPAGSTCVGVGAALPGVVRAPDGLVRIAPNLGWVDVPFGARLAERLGLGLPVVVGNDADLGALAEHLRGCAVGCTDLVYLCGEVGLGGGIITGGRPLEGADGYGGEVGHWVVNPEGQLCRCGSRGCWETEVNEHALLGASGLSGPAGVVRLVRVAEAGDPGASRTLFEVGRWLAIGVAGLVNVLNPQVVVFGGHLATVLPVVRRQVEERLASTTLGPHREAVRLAVPALGQRSALLGAAELAFAALLADPVGHLGRRASGSPAVIGG